MTISTLKKTAFTSLTLAALAASLSGPTPATADSGPGCDPTIQSCPDPLPHGCGGDQSCQPRAPKFGITQP